MKVLILGNRGYLGHALHNYLEAKGFEVLGIDNGLRQRNVEKVGSRSLIPPEPISSIECDVLDYPVLKDIVSVFSPDVIVHFAEQPSAPFSMRSREDAYETQRNNVLGSLNVLWAIRECNPNIHLVKLGTMGVYGTPEADIPESNGPIAYDPGSFYHITKAMDSINIRKACQWWGLRATDLHQGVVYGHIKGTRFDYDYCFGTVINRFLTQALARIPLTVYGKGGQTRGFINIADTMQCIEIAILNPPKGYRVFNQLTEIFSVNYIANAVRELTGADIEHIDNPRVELEEHYYQVAHNRLLKLGLKPRYFVDELPHIWQAIEPYKSNIVKEAILPQTAWV